MQNLQDYQPVFTYLHWFTSEPSLINCYLLAAITLKLFMLFLTYPSNTAVCPVYFFDVMMLQIVFKFLFNILENLTDSIDAVSSILWIELHFRGTTWDLPIKGAINVIIIFQLSEIVGITTSKFTASGRCWGLYGLNIIWLVALSNFKLVQSVKVL